MSAFLNMSRQRGSKETKNVYGPDLEFTGAALANELYGPGAAYGGYGMSGGQFPNTRQDAPGYGTNTYGNIYRNPGGYASGGGNKTPTNGYQYGAQGELVKGGGGGLGGAAALWGQGGASGNRQMTGAQAFEGYSSMIANPGFSPEVQAMLRTRGTNAANAPYLNAKSDLGRRAAITGQGTGAFAAALADLSRGQAVTTSDAARETELGIAGEAMRQKEVGLHGMQGLFGTETGFTAQQLGLRAALAQLQRRQYEKTRGTSGSGGVSMGMGG